MMESRADRKSRILVVEDNAAFRKILKTRLESVGYETMTAQDGLEGLNMARREKPDLVVLDLMLPGLDGHKVCRLLKSDRKYGHIPIVIFTSRDLDEDAELAETCGADGFVLKTTRSEVMMDVMMEVMMICNDGGDDDDEMMMVEEVMMEVMMEG